MKWGKILFIGAIFAVQALSQFSYAEQIKFQGNIAEFTCSSESALNDCQKLKSTQSNLREAGDAHLLVHPSPKLQTVSLDLYHLETEQHRVLLVQYH